MIREDRAAGDAMVALVGDRVAGEVDQKLRHVEGMMRDKSAGSIDLEPIENRLNDIEAVLLGSDDRHQAVEAITSRVEAAENAISGRITRLQQAQAIDRDQVLTQQAADIQRAESGLRERVSALGRLIQDTHVERVEQAKKLDVVETMLIQQSQSAAEGREASVQQLGEVHEAIVKLNANQHTLAGAIDQWRSGTVNDMNAISLRLALLDQDSELPLQRLEQISERMDGMHRATVERYHRRNRF